MLPYRDSRLTQIALVVFFVIVLGYAYYEGRGLLFGPSITVPSELQTVSEPYIRLKGTADRISSLSLNGKHIAVTEQGKFDEPYLLAEGLNRIALDATDKYGRTSQKIIQILYIPSIEPILEIAATTSPSTIIATSTPTSTSN